MLQASVEARVTGVAGPHEEGTMTKLADTLRENTVGVARRAYKSVEAKVLVAEGKKSMRKKAATVAKVTRKATKAGLVAGAVVASAVVLREIRRRRKMG
jgi:hypothetical protein